LKLPIYSAPDSYWSFNDDIWSATIEIYASIETKIW